MELDVYTLQASREFADQVAKALGLPLGKHEERDFEDGEHKVRALENVRGNDVYVIQSLYSDDRWTVNDKLIRLLFFLGALKDAGAGRTTAVIPYLAYARKDRRTKLRDPVSTRYLAALFEAVGLDRVITMDVHNLAAYENAFRIPTSHLESRVLFVAQAVQAYRDQEVVVASPDVGGIKRAEAFRQDLEDRLQRTVTSAFMEKQRSAGVVSGEALVGEVEDRTVLVVDDLISSGTTQARCAEACLSRGAARVHGIAAHGAFVGDANDKLAGPSLERILITDTVPPFRVTNPALADKLHTLSSAPLFAAAIRRLHEGGDVEELLVSPP